MSRERAPLGRTVVEKLIDVVELYLNGSAAPSTAGGLANAEGASPRGAARVALGRLGGALDRSGEPRQVS